MQFFEYGKPDGVPLLFFLGTPQTGESVAYLSGLATELGVRLICPTRPWYLDSKAEPTFEACTARAIAYFADHDITRAAVMGGSGGGPFALHAATSHPDVFGACYLLASIGDPVVFRETVRSRHTQAILELFGGGDRDRAVSRMTEWGIPPALAHGAWADFQVLLGSWSTIDFTSAVPVYIHHGPDDDNAPLESVEALVPRLPACELRLSPQASHAGLATDHEHTAFREIFAEVVRIVPGMQ